MFRRLSFEEYRFTYWNELLDLLGKTIELRTKLLAPLIYDIVSAFAAELVKPLGRKDMSSHKAKR